MKPVVAVTMGDPAGIGPEVLCRAAMTAEVKSACRVLAIGDAAWLRRAIKVCGLQIGVHAVSNVSEARFLGESLECLQVATVPEDLDWGRLDPRAGEVAFRCVEGALRLAMEGAVDALCTAPLNKQALHLAGYLYPGHTELLAALTGSRRHAMLLSCPGLRVVHVTTHVGLVDAVTGVTPQRVREVLDLGNAALRSMGISHPRIGVCGLNPHAGENGLFGRGEEEESIVPAVLDARAQGLLVDGPLPADTLFARALRGEFDLVVAMYHDQGHIPVKLLGLDAGVNITLGLPIIRTSVDHGTAFDIAGRGVADHRSMVAALLAAATMAETVGAGDGGSVCADE